MNQTAFAIKWGKAIHQASSNFLHSPLLEVDLVGMYASEYRKMAVKLWTENSEYPAEPETQDDWRRLSNNLRNTILVNSAYIVGLKFPLIIKNPSAIRVTSRGSRLECHDKQFVAIEPLGSCHDKIVYWASAFDLITAYPPDNITSLCNENKIEFDVWRRIMQDWHIAVNPKSRFKTRKEFATEFGHLNRDTFEILIIDASAAESVDAILKFIPVHPWKGGQNELHEKDYQSLVERFAELSLEEIIIRMNSIPKHIYLNHLPPPGMQVIEVLQCEWFSINKVNHMKVYILCENEHGRSFPFIHFAPRGIIADSRLSGSCNGFANAEICIANGKLNIAAFHMTETPEA